MSPVAAVDCGTNSTRLLVADDDGTTLRREMRITRLGEGVDSTGELAPAALERTYAVLAEYAGYMGELGVGRGRLVATSAARDAANGTEFLAEAARLSGCEVALLTGEEEAELSYLGATADLAPDERPTMIVDIGGGSTELAARVDGRLAAVSMQVGCVRVAERALGPGVVTPETEAAARDMVREALASALSATPALAGLVGGVRVVGLAGTVSTLAQLEAGLCEYRRDAVHHRVITRSTVDSWFRRLGAESPVERLGHPGMVKGREDVLAAGLVILEEVLDRFGVDRLLSSESDILDGIVTTLLEG